MIQFFPAPGSGAEGKRDKLTSQRRGMCYANSVSAETQTDSRSAMMTWYGCLGVIALELRYDRNSNRSWHVIGDVWVSRPTRSIISRRGHGRDWMFRWPV